jgi:hypothetical protein
MISLELADGHSLDLGCDSQWSIAAEAPQVAATANPELSVSELQQAIRAGLDPTADLKATTAGGAGGGGGGGHSAVVLDATGAQVNATAGYETQGFGFAVSGQREEQANTSTVNNIQEGPTATPSTSAGDEEASITVALAGTDTNGTVSPDAAQGVLYLVNGITAVVAVTAIGAAQAADLVFKPAANFNGQVTVSFTVTDNEGNTSASVTVEIMPGETSVPYISSRCP